MTERDREYRGGRKRQRRGGKESEKAVRDKDWKGGVWREPVQKMELEATVALLYLDGKIRIQVDSTLHERKAQTVTYMLL